jgi:transcriptional regulator NrdR family protein
MVQTSETSLERCVHCGARGARVTDSRPSKMGRFRTKVCDSCGKRWRTIELPVDVAAPLIHRTDVVRTAYVELARLEAVIKGLRTKLGRYGNERLSYRLEDEDSD